MFGFIERWRVRRSFAKYVSPEVLKLLEDAPTRYDVPAPKKKHFQFIVIQLEDSDPDAVPSLIARVSKVFASHQSTYPTLAHGILVACLGTIYPELNSPELRMRIVSGLVAELGSKVRIVHGHGTGYAGSLGGSPRFYWDALIPHFSKVLEELNRLDFGTAKELETSSEARAL
jgi:hypothetical protein